MINKIDRFFNRVMLEENTLNTIQMNNKIFYSFGYSEENRLCNPFELGYAYLVDDYENAQLWAKASVKNKNAMGITKIPTIISGYLNNASLLDWDHSSRIKYGKLFPEGIVSKETVNKEILKQIENDGIIYPSVVPTVIMLNSDKFNITNYTFYIADEGWGEAYNKEDALSHLNSIFILNQHSL